MPIDPNDYGGDYELPDPDSDDRPEFADPGGKSALRAGKRIYPCPTCKLSNKLTAKDKQLGYQCDACADRDEGGGYGRPDY